MKIEEPGNGSFVTAGGTTKIPAALTEKKVSKEGKSDPVEECSLKALLCFKIFRNLLGVF